MNPLSLDYLGYRSQTSWLIGIDNQAFVELTDRLYRQLQQQVSSISTPRILLLDPDPTRFLAGFLAACMARHPVFLGNPGWTDNEQKQVLKLIQPAAILIAGCWNDAMDFRSSNKLDSQSYNQLAKNDMPSSAPATIMIPTGGSSGQLRFAIHTWDTLMASVWGFQHHFGVDRIHSYCLLPLHHVSGLMQWLRAYLSGGQFAWQPYKHLLAGQPLNLDSTEFFISLVPTQLQQLLNREQPIPPEPSITDWLRQFRAVLVGGAPLWQSLWTQAHHLRLPLAPTYGMTETASQVATLLPAEFLAGKTGSGRSLLHAQLSIHDSDGNPLPVGNIGTIAIQSSSLCLGYWQVSGARFQVSRKAVDIRYPTPEISLSPDTYHLTPNTWHLSDDLGFLDVDGYLHVIGRNSNKIITGGENVFPAEVEAAILATGLVADVYVMGVPDRQWGEAVTAVYVPVDTTITATQLQEAMDDRLSGYKQPKHWVATSALPRNFQGKINLEQVRQIIAILDDTC